MHIRISFISIFTISFLCLAQTAHADFHKALDAYIARDGNTVLKEVKDAVEKKNDDGLLLFLMATNMDAAASDYDETTKQSKTTLKAILPSPKLNELRELLIQAAKSSTLDVQYYLLTSSQFRNETVAKTVDEYAAKGSRFAMLKTDIESKAKAGSPFAQLILGLKYLNYTDYIGYGCADSKEDICQTKNEEKGFYWLRKAAESYEASGSSSLGIYADSMCDLFQHEPKFDNPAGNKQAYLWCLLGINSGGPSSMRLMGMLHASGKLKVAAPDLNDVWENSQKRNTKLFLTDLTRLPDWILEARENFKKEDIPQISFSFNGYMPYKLDIYKDGRVTILNNIDSDTIQSQSVLFRKVSPDLIKAFLAEVKKIGFYDWPLSQFPSGLGSCDKTCNATGMQLTIRSGEDVRRINLISWSFDKELDIKNISTQRMAKIKTIVDKFFPTKQLRIELGNSKKIKQQMLDYDTQWQLALNKEN